MNLILKYFLISQRAKKITVLKYERLVRLGQSSCRGRTQDSNVSLANQNSTHDKCDNTNLDFY